MAHKPISMRCTREQFEEIRPILEANNKEIDVIDFKCNKVLVNNYQGNTISDLHFECRHDFDRFYYDTWNAEIFLDACGIATEKERGISITHVKDMLETDNKYDVAIRIVEIVTCMQHGKLTTSAAGELIAAEIEAYAEMKVQQAKGGNNE
jgi:hypothetical protein